MVLDLAALDRSVYGAVAATPTPALDGVMRRLSAAADHSKLSFAVAGLLALRGCSPRRAAVLGPAAIGRARERTGLDKAVTTGRALLTGRPVALVVCEFGFLGGSIGVATAVFLCMVRITAAVQAYHAAGLPYASS